VLLKQLTVAIDDLKNGNVDPQLSKAGLRVLRLQAMNEDPSSVAQPEKERGSGALARLFAADRQRLARHRRACKLVCVTVELRHSEIQALICQGRLKPSECADRGAPCTASSMLTWGRQSRVTEAATAQYFSPPHHRSWTPKSPFENGYS
jgi:hypothetical protein